MRFQFHKSFQHRVEVVLLFTVMLAIAFLPLTSFLFYLKNDAFLNYFPPKFFMSESIHAGHLPLWNPYVNYGIPQYADMNAGYWSPITWLLASTVGYNAYTFTLELFFYLIAGGLGAYKLTGIWVSDTSTKLLAGFAFMCCGFNVGHLQHFNWISGAAFLPWCFWSYYLMIKTGSTRQSLLTAICFYLFIASAHPGMIIGAIYFFLALFVYAFLIVKLIKHKDKSSINIWSAHAVFLAAMLLLGAGIIAGYTDVLPHFLRGEKLTLAQSLANPTTFISWISTILPLSTVKNHVLFGTDISMRNCYFSLTLLLFFLLACVQKKTGLQRFLIASGVFFALLSSGGFFKTVAYDVIPLIGYVRLNGEFRIFSLLCFIVTAVIEMNKFLIGDHSPGTALQSIVRGVAVFLFAATLYAVYKILHINDSILYNITAVTNQDGLTTKLKTLIENLSFYDTLWIQGTIQLISLHLIWQALRKKNSTKLLMVTSINLVIITLCNVPFTGSGKTSVKTFQTILDKSPSGIPIPSLKPIVSNDTLSASETRLVGDWNIYNKQIGNLAEYPYPIVLKNMRERYLDTQGIRASSSKPFLFLLPVQEPKAIDLVKFTPNALAIRINSESAGTLILQQNHYPHWYYSSGVTTRKVDRHVDGLMLVPLQPGTNDVSIFFKPTLVKWMMVVSLLSLLGATLYLIYVRFK